MEKLVGKFQGHMPSFFSFSIVNDLILPLSKYFNLNQTHCFFGRNTFVSVKDACTLRACTCNMYVTDTTNTQIEQSKADDTLAATAAMIAARNSCMHSWRQGVPDTLAAMTTAVSGSDYALSCYLDTVREQRHCTPSPSNRCKQTEGCGCWLAALSHGQFPTCWNSTNGTHCCLQATISLCA